jgi:hypothetical protein
MWCVSRPSLPRGMVGLAVDDEQFRELARLERAQAVRRAHRQLAEASMPGENAVRDLSEEMPRFAGATDRHQRRCRS